MKRSLALLAALGLFACATSIAPPNDGVIVGGGAEAGDDGNQYGGSDSGSDAGDPLADSGQSQDASDTGAATDSGVDTGPASAAGVCSKTTIQKAEYAAAFIGGGAVDCSGGPSACATGECCYQGSLSSLCVGQ